jgi:hypothetical protein
MSRLSALLFTKPPPKPMILIDSPPDGGTHADAVA